MSFAVGSLVRARGREWVVLPDSDDDLLVLRPLGGTEDEIAGVLPVLEPVEPATFALPTVDDLGDHRSARMLRDALRLGFRSSAGPFRSFGSLDFEPRPYQLVPLLMSLRLDPVRLLVADDVGTGKTASTLMVAAELLAQGRVRGLAVLCPPHLATQWQDEMRDKFHLDAVVVLPSTAGRLERGCQVGETLFNRHDITIVSTEYIKADRRRAEFLRTAPELVIVDEAHTCAFDSTSSAGRQLRHELLKGLAANPERHLVLVTATPHSGKEEAFRSLLSLLDGEFADLPDDLSGERNRRVRERIARHMVQRRRGDLRRYLEVDTPFPERKEAEASYQLSPQGHALFDAALAYARETVRDTGTSRHRQRMRWWSVLALLRSLASSPAAALDTLEKRSPAADTTTESEADAAGRRAVMDTGDDDADEYDDRPAGATLEHDTTDAAGDAATASARRRLNELKKLAEACRGPNDAKLAGLVDIVAQLLRDGFNPIVFCRYIPTAGYVADELARRFPAAGVRSVTGKNPSSERAAIVAELEPYDRRILVATDCLSEGINLQNNFDAVVHYDLSWNPTRHEQREGRVDRYGQPTPEVRVVTYFGADNRIDDIVLDVLIRKHKTIRNSLGYSVPVPGDPNSVAEAVLEGLLTKEDRARQPVLPGLEPSIQLVLDNWESAAERERRSRTVFAQETIKPDEVAAELAEVRSALGETADVRRFLTDALVALRAHVTGTDPVTVDLTHVPSAATDAMNLAGTSTVTVRFEPPAAAGQLLVTRTHPMVSGLAAHVLDCALDPLRAGPASRCGVIRTDAVATRTTLLVARYRFDLYLGGGDTQLLAEDAAVLAFTGSPDDPVWLPSDELDGLLAARPTAEVVGPQARQTIETVLAGAPALQTHLDRFAAAAAAQLRDSHNRARTAVRMRTTATRVDARTPVDLLGIYVLLTDKRAI
jgi:superfamily II DNA or RNA helicase